MLAFITVIAFIVQYASSTCPSPCTCATSYYESVSTRLYTLNCMNKGLTAIPDNPPSNVRMAWLSGNNLGELTPDIFAQKGYENVTVFQLGSAGITKIHGYAFRGIKEVTRILLDSNNLTEIATNSFSLSYRQLYNVGDLQEYINLEGNKIGTVHPKAFDGLRGTEDNSNFFNVGLAIKFGKQQTRLTFKSSAFSGLKTANVLIESAELEIEVGAFVNSSVGVKVEKSTILDIPSGAFTGMKNVPSFFFLDNTFSAIHSGSFADVGFFITGPDRYKATLNNLVLFRRNKIDYFGSHVFEGVINSQIRFIDNTMKNFSTEPFYGLDTGIIYMSGNNMSVLPRNFIKGLKAQEVYMNDNILTRIDDYSLSQVSNLTKLTIKYTNLYNVALGDFIFSGLQDIGTILLQKVHIPIVKTTLFAGISRVNMLQINTCGVEDIESGAFLASQGIKTLDLSTGTLLACNCTTYSQYKVWKEVIGTVGMSCVRNPDYTGWNDVVTKCSTSSTATHVYVIYNKIHFLLMAVYLAFLQYL